MTALRGGHPVVIKNRSRTDVSIPSQAVARVMAGRWDEEWSPVIVHFSSRTGDLSILHDASGCF